MFHKNYFKNWFLTHFDSKTQRYYDPKDKTRTQHLETFKKVVKYIAENEEILNSFTWPNMQIDFPVVFLRKNIWVDFCITHKSYFKTTTLFTWIDFYIYRDHITIKVWTSEKSTFYKKTFKLKNGKIPFSKRKELKELIRNSLLTFKDIIQNPEGVHNNGT